MDKCSPIQEYYNCKYGNSLASDNVEISNKELHELLVRMRNEQIQHLREQDLLLRIIRKQSKPQFWREVGANLTADAFFEIALRLGSKIFRP